MTTFEDLVGRAELVKARVQEVGERWQRTAADLLRVHAQLQKRVADFPQVAVECGEVADLEIATIDELQARSQATFDRLTERLQDAEQRLARGYEAFLESVRSRYAETLESLRDAHEQAIEQARARIDEAVEHNQEVIGQTVATCESWQKSLEEQLLAVVSRLERMRERVKDAGATLGRVMQGVSEAQQAASAGIQGAVGALRSVQSVMDEIF
jgi:chromosome segregation ATPase